MSEPVLVTGGTGTVGRALVQRLLTDGRRVRALARSRASANALEAAGTEAVPGDVLDRDSLVRALRGCTSLFHAAGVNEMCPRDPNRLILTNVQGSANAIRAAAEARLERVVYTSSGSAIGERRDTVGHEDAPHRGSYLSAYERSKHLAERRVVELSSTLGVPTIILNPASVQGPGRSTGSARLLIEVVNGRLPVLVDTDISVIDIGDCAEGHVLAESRGIPGERYVLSGASLSTRDAVELLDRIWGLRRRVLFGPRWLARVGGAVVGAGARILRRDAPLCSEAVRTLLHGHRYDGSKATRDLGLRYTPLEDTLVRTLEWCAERGLVPPGRRERAGT